MRQICAFFLILVCLTSEITAQEFVLNRGVVIDSFPTQDSISSQLKLYLPNNFEVTRTWPLLFICDLEGDVVRAMRYLSPAADRNGYILAASGATRDSSSLTDKVLLINSTLEKLKELLPIDRDRIYTAGYDRGGQLATLIPSLIRPVRGVLSVSSILPNLELINPKQPFDYVGVMGRADYQYLSLVDDEQVLDQRKIPNHLVYHPGTHERPEPIYMEYALQALDLMAMKGKGAEPDTALIRSNYNRYQSYILKLEDKGELLLAMDQVEEGLALFDDLADTDWLKNRRKYIRANRDYKDQKREWERVRLQELLIQEDFRFYLEEDVISFNLNNLGWWNHQMGRIIQFKESTKREEQLLGLRLEGYLNALVDDYIDLYNLGPAPDDDALIFLFMLKTITDPSQHENYLKVISLTAKYSDFGTANFYLEELLKKGYTDADRLYELPNTALLRISPEFNKLIAQYLGSARYAIEE